MIAIYVRVSTEEQAKKGYSIQSQIEECRSKAGTNEILEYVDEGYSGAYLERPQLQKLRDDVREGTIHKVICYDPDRLSRKLMNALIIDDEFRKKGVQMVYVNGEYENTPEGQLFYSLRQAVSEFEKAKINQRLSGGRRKKAKDGKIIKNSHLYGYSFENGYYVINEKESEIVRYIFESYIDGKGMNGIAKELTRKNVPTKRGKGIWHRNVVRQILKNESYTGRHYQNKYNTEGMIQNKYITENKIKQTLRPKEEWIENKIPPIITEEEFNYVQECLELARQRFSKTRTYLLSGLVRCVNCGNTMTGKNGHWWSKTTTIYTDKKNSSGAKHPGCGTYAFTEDLDNAVWEKVKELLNDPDKIHEHQEKYDFSRERSELIRLNDELQKISKGKKRMYDLLLLSDELDVNEIKERIVDSQKKEKEIKEEISKLEKKINEVPGEKDYNLLKQALYDFLEKDEATFDDKQELIRKLVKEVLVHDREEAEIILF